MSDFLNQLFPDAAIPERNKAQEEMLQRRGFERRFLELQDIVVDLGIGPGSEKRYVYASTDLGSEGKGSGIFVIDSDLVANALSRDNVMSLDSFKSYIQKPGNEFHEDDFVDALKAAEELSEEQVFDILVQLQTQHAVNVTVNDLNNGMHA